MPPPPHASRQPKTSDAELLARIAHLEALLLLPTDAAASAAPPQSAEEVAALKKALARANYRILHLSRAYDALTAAAAAAPPPK